MDGLSDAIAMVAGFVILALVLRHINKSGEPEPERDPTDSQLG